jgi:hypothetical protein
MPQPQVQKQITQRSLQLCDRAQQKFHSNTQRHVHLNGINLFLTLRLIYCTLHWRISAGGPVDIRLRTIMSRRKYQLVRW